MLTLSKYWIAILCAVSFAIGAAGTFIVMHRSSASACSSASDSQFLKGKVANDPAKSF